MLSAMGLPLSAQAPPSPTWSYSVTPYFWMSGVKGNVGVGRVAVHVDESFGDILDALKFGVMAYGEARVSKYFFGLDGMYVSLGDEKSVAFRGDTGSFSVGQRETMLQPSVGTSIGGATWGLDALLSARYWRLSATLDVSSTNRPPNSRDGSKQWVDGLIGGRAHWSPMTRVHLIGGADGGAGGSRDTWQLYGAVAGDAMSWLTVSASYRSLLVDYDRSDFLFDTRTSGFLIAATVKF
jgi:hypothetical protein